MALVLIPPGLRTRPRRAAPRAGPALVDGADANTGPSRSIRSVIVAAYSARAVLRWRAEPPIVAQPRVWYNGRGQRRDDRCPASSR